MSELDGLSKDCEHLVQLCAQARGQPNLLPAVQRDLVRLARLLQRQVRHRRQRRGLTPPIMDAMDAMVQVQLHLEKSTGGVGMPGAGTNDRFTHLEAATQAAQSAIASLQRSWD